VSGNIPNLLGTWGSSTIILGKSVNRERKSKERKFVWVGTTVLHIDFFGNEDQVERRKESLDLVHPWRVNYSEIWSVLEHICSCKLKR
jgi:hypothetical protein